MKKIAATVCLLCFVLLLNAQTITKWKLSTHLWNGAGWTGKWEYKYDSSFLLKTVNYYQDKKLFTVSKNFTHNAAGNITSYEDVYLQGADPQKFYFTYADNNELTTKKIIHYKQGKQNFTEEFKYTWAKNKVTAIQTVVSKNGISSSTIIYTLDDKKNIISKVTKTGTFYTETETFKDIVATPNPYASVDYPYNKEVVSPNNSTYVSGSTSPSTIKIKTNTVGLTTSIAETIDNGPYNIVNTDSFSYIKIK